MRVSPRLLQVAVAALLLAVPSIVRAQPFLLQIKPRVGDTVSVKLDQRIEMSGAPMDCMDGERKSGREMPRHQPCSAASRQMTTVTEVYSKAIVTGKSRDGVLVLAVTDSIRSATGSGSVVGPARRIRSRNESIALRVAPDGGAEVVDSNASADLRELFGQMPAMLSKKPVAVGGKWKSEMRIPIAGETGAMGLVRATFQLDSLGRNGDIAYISMRGTLTHDHRDGSDSELDGTMTCSMQLDRRLSWITSTHAEINATSIFRPATGGGPMRVRTHIIQSLKAGPAR